MRSVISLVILLCGPLALGVIGWGLILIYKTAGLAVFLGCCFVLFIAVLGIASLIDKAEMRHSPRRDAR